MIVESSLLHMYTKCEDIHNAIWVFEKMSQYGLVSWNSMIVGYAQDGHDNEAIPIPIQM